VEIDAYCRTSITIYFHASFRKLFAHMTDIAIDAYDRQIENRQNRVHERVDPDL